MMPRCYIWEMEGEVTSEGSSSSEGKFVSKK
jgi:hypothetical protein